MKLNLLVLLLVAQAGIANAVECRAYENGQEVCKLAEAIPDSGYFLCEGSQWKFKANLFGDQKISIEIFRTGNLPAASLMAKLDGEGVILKQAGLHDRRVVVCKP